MAVHLGAYSRDDLLVDTDQPGTPLCAVYGHVTEYLQ